MASLEAAVRRIKVLECPTGELSNRVTAILADYQIAKPEEISIGRQQSMDRDGSQAYRAEIAGTSGETIVFFARSGNDDYVAKVTEAYIR